MQLKLLQAGQVPHGIMEVSGKAATTQGENSEGAGTSEAAITEQVQAAAADRTVGYLMD